MICDAQGEYVGVVPGVTPTVVDTFRNMELKVVLLSASRLAVHRFATTEYVGSLSLFNNSYP
jgi:hypothetical protein